MNNPSGMSGLTGYGIGAYSNMCPYCGGVYPHGQYHQCPQQQLQQSYGYGVSTTTSPMFSGSKPIVVCAGQSVECKDLDEAQSKAEQYAHQYQADAFILKPIRKVSPKREVISTDLK